MATDDPARATVNGVPPYVPAGDVDARDHAARIAATTDLDATLLLEAGAGTGKTTVLVERYLECLRRGTPAARVVAITFTEKAAGELRLRVRQSLGEEAAADGASEETAERLGAALAAIDEAPISTIHSFAARLLRERPVEAGIDPAFSQLDAIESDLLTTRLWSDFVTAALGGDGEAGAGTEAMADVLGAGVSLETLREVVLGGKGMFHQRYDLQFDAVPPERPDLHPCLEELESSARRLLQYCEDFCCDDADKGLELALRAAEKTLEVCAEPAGDLHSLAAQLAALPLWKEDPGGRQPSWGGKEGKQAFGDTYRELRTSWLKAREQYETFVAAQGLAVAHEFIMFADREQLRLGVLDFADLLGRLRNLLRDRPDVRRDFQETFDFLLVDEFQDTNPLQAEIVFLLAEDGEGRELRELASDWKDVRLRPGKLFIVGDPKQSIYRFRRADITLYQDVQTLLQRNCGDDAVRYITRNFRTVSPLVDWVNQVFHEVIGRDAFEGRQPPYEALLAHRVPRTPGPRVTVLYGQDVADETSAEAHRIEAEQCAALLVEVHECRDGSWEVHDKSEKVWRAPQWSDVTVLFRSFSSLEHFEEAFRAAGVPYRVDGGRTYFGRREVADALLALRAVADAADGPAVYGTLHSSLFGFSDEELVMFRAAGGVFDYLAEAQPQDHAAVVQALALLDELHVLRLDAEPHVVLGELLRRTRALEFHATRGEEGRQAVGNLEKLVDRARAFAGAAGGGLGEFVRWAESAAGAGDEAESAGEDPGDVVRIMTIHKAKGLDAHIVVVAAGTHKPMSDGKVPLIDRRLHRAAIFLAAAKPGGVKLPSGVTYGFATPGYAARLEDEKKMAASERRRLFYVAATRARDHLVVLNIGKPDANCLLQPWVTNETLPEQGSVEPGEPQAPEGRHMVLRRAPELTKVPADDAPPALETLAAARQAWQARHEADVAQASRPAGHATPSSLERLDELPGGGPGGDATESDQARLTPPHAGRGDALALGGAVHRTMELCRLDDPDSVAAAAVVAADEALIPHKRDDVVRLATACWRSDLVRQAAGAPHWREVPVGLALEPDGLLQGAVDLVYERDGELVIVDYKTDRDADVEAAERRYALQLGAYALALTQATGKSVAEAWIVMAAGGGPDGPAPAARIAVTAELLEAAREAAAVAAEADASLVDEL